jgi:uncharacterized iron-regulated membrane protein
VRRAAFAVHRRLAVVLGLWIVFQSLTGLILVFRDPIEHWTHPGLTRHGHGDRGAAAALDAVRRKYPDEVVGALATPEVSDGVYVVEVGDREVYVDPARARINGSEDDEGGFVALVYRLHRRFLFDSVFGSPGARLVATLGLAWVVVSVTGLTTATAGGIGRWWRRGQLTRRPEGRGCPPARKRRPMPAGARRTPHILHRTIGVVVVAPMVLVTVTGIRLAVPAGSDRIWAAVTGSGHGRYDTPPKTVSVTSDDRGGDPLDATQILRALDRKYPDGRVARLLMPFEGDRTAPVIAGVSVGLDPGRGQHDYGGNTVVFLDQFSADTLWEGRPDSLPAARQAALLWSRPLHGGSFAGDMSGLAWGWLALAVVALGLSGYVSRRVRTLEARLESMRWQRQLRRRKVLAEQQRVRSAQAARHRRRAGRRLRRRRKVQAQARALALAWEQEQAQAPRPPKPLGSNDTTTTTGLAGDAIPVPVVYESEITLESGDTLESGIVAPLPRR